RRSPTGSSQFAVRAERGRHRSGYPAGGILLTRFRQEVEGSRYCGVSADCRRVRRRRQMKFVLTVRPIVFLVALMLSAFVGVGTSSAAPPPVSIQSGCTGDTISGSVLLKKGGHWPVSLGLMSKSHSGSAFSQSAAPRQVTGSGDSAP